MYIYIYIYTYIYRYIHTHIYIYIFHCRFFQGHDRMKENFVGRSSRVSSAEKVCLPKLPTHVR